MTSDELIAWRAKWQLSQRDLAAIIPVSNSTIHKWEREKRPPKWFDRWARDYERERWDLINEPIEK